MLHLLLTALVTASATSLPGQNPSSTLSCDRPEAAVLRTAPSGVRRVSKHRLIIRWTGGVRAFADTGDDNGELGGVRYEYCGVVLGYHLIRKVDDGLSTGVLLDTATGRLLPAGQMVSFSPDTTRYFATQQPDGMDGEEWLLYSRRGVQLWKGESGISAKSASLGYEYFIATLEAPHWSPRGQVEASLRCVNDTTRTTMVSLVASGARYRWTPIEHCHAIP